MTIEFLAWLLSKYWKITWPKILILLVILLAITGYVGLIILATIHPWVLFALATAFVLVWLTLVTVGWIKENLAEYHREKM